jgi:c-di-AMP phosphodiesterase-like protein
MELIHLRSLINVLAMLVGIIASILVFSFPSYSSLIFTIEVIVLPTIYIVGNAYIEDKITGEYQDIISNISKDAEIIKQKYIETAFLNKELYYNPNKKRTDHGR